MKRIEVSLLRTLAMVMVVAYHCVYQFAFGYPMCDNAFSPIEFYLHLNKFLNSIDMPMFVLVSGYLLAYLKTKKGKYSDGKDFFIKKAKRLLLPFFIWVILTDLLVFGKIDYTHFYYSVCHLWFLLMLMWCFVFAFFTQKLWEQFSLWLNAAFCAVFFSVYFILSKLGLLTNLFCIDSFLIYFPIFYVGIIWARFSILENLVEKVSLHIFSLSSILFVAFTWCLTSNEFPLHSDLLARICGVLFSLSIFQALYKYMEKVDSMPAWFTSIDESGMGIYILHQILIILLLQQSSIALFTNDHYIVGPILLFVSVFAICWLLSALIRKTRLKFIFG